MVFPALIAAAASIYGARQASKQASKARNQDAKLRKLIEAGLEYSQPYGQQLISGGTSALNKARTFYGNILSGNRNTLMGAMGPEINALGDSYQSAAQNIGEFAPRGGATSSFWTQLPFQQARDQNDMLMRARPEAANALAGMGGQMAGMGQGLLTGNSSQGLGLLDLNRLGRRDEFAMGSDLGSGLAGLVGSVDWSKVDWGKMFGRNPGAGGGGAGWGGAGGGGGGGGGNFWGGFGQDYSQSPKGFMGIKP
jgi:hypothetical protein